MTDMKELPILSIVMEVIRSVLAVDDAAKLNEDTPLADLNGFDSLAIVRMIEALEERLETEMDPDLIVPEVFETPMSLAKAFNPFFISIGG